jgi:hypothetical protein
MYIMYEYMSIVFVACAEETYEENKKNEKTVYKNNVNVVFVH